MRIDYFLTTLKRVAVIPFPFNGFSPTPFAIEPYSYWFGYSGFPPLFYNSTKRIFPNPDMGIVVEPSPSTQVPYDLRSTLGCLAA